ncbi:MAG: filamentous hemagglutinin N-terminal domain-containing protein [Nostoc sp.]|uniref:two-partner secretion domain-containing protein n=1 Tax=Nostoc sp. TaxID=1180 RepID=UPI002FFC22AE
MHKTKIKIEWGKASNFLFKASILYYISFSNPTAAQIVPDTSLTNNSRVTNQGSIDIINEGTRAGTNLFHSFQDFSVSTGNTAFFNNAADITNIISRVTGKSVSNINGLIRANGIANLFLLNPNGIIFGSNAQLNIGGSFVATTANSIKFADGKQFFAQPNQKEPLLTISAPTGLVFRDNSTGTIQVLGGGHRITPNAGLFPTIVNNNSTGLLVQPGKTLALIGSNVNLEGGIITTPGGQSELGSVGSGFVDLKSNNQGWTFDYEGVRKFEDIQLSKQALINASGTGAGTIQVHGNNVHLTDGSTMLIQNLGETSSGNININASRSLVLEGTSPNGNISSSILTETVNTGKGGDLKVFTQRLTLQDGARVGAGTYSNASGGNVTINASDSVQLLENRLANPFRRGDTISLISAATFASGQAGSVQMSTDQLRITDGGTVASSSFGTGDGNNVIVNADFIEITGIKPERSAPSTIAAAAFNAGNAGSININTSQLRLKNGGIVNSVAFATGNAGSININAENFIEVSGKASNSQPSFISSSANVANETVRKIFGLPLIPTGSAGNITIDTPLLNVNQGGLISVANGGLSDAGRLEIKSNTINITNSGGVTATTTAGQGGDINITSNNIFIRNGIISTTAGQQGTNGDGGNININTNILVLAENSSITANAFKGRGGNILINARGLFFSPNSKITASSQFGLNGDVQINGFYVDPNGIESVPEGLAQSPKVASACQGQSDVAESEFVMSGVDRLPLSPNDVPPIKPTWQDNFVSSQVNNNSEEPKLQKQSTQIVEAQGWVQDSYGNVTLTAEANSATPYAASFASLCSEENVSKSTITTHAQQ